MPVAEFSRSVAPSSSTAPPRWLSWKASRLSGWASVSTTVESSGASTVAMLARLPAALPGAEGVVASLAAGALPSLAGAPG